MTLYNQDIRTFIQTREWPKGLQYEVIEYPDYLALRFFRSNIVSLSPGALEQLESVVMQTMMALRKNGTPIFLEKEE